MSAHIEESRLYDFLDGLLPAPDAATVAAHLRACARCAGEAAALRGLLGELHGLPREILPARDLRPAIGRALARAAGDPAEPALPGRTVSLPTRRALRQLRYPLAAAAVLLVAVTAVVTRWAVQRPEPVTGALLRPGSAPAAAPAQPAPSPSAAAQTPAPSAPPAPAAAPPARPGASLAAFRREERRYTDQIAALQRDLEARRDQLSPATRRILERNLVVIDRALAESRAALAREPASRVLAPLVLSAYEQKVQLLRRARESSS